MQELVDGGDSESLRILAGLTPPGAWSDADEWLPRALDELGYERPDEETCIRQYAGDVAAALVNGEISPDEAIADLYAVSRDLGRPDWLWEWVFLHEDLHPLVYRELDPGERAALAVELAREMLSKWR